MPPVPDRHFCQAFFYLHIFLQESHSHNIQGLFFVWILYVFTSFSNGLWYLNGCSFVWILYVFTSFSNIHEPNVEMSIVWILYVFTSFSNLKFKNEVPHTHIHYSIQPILINRLHIHLCQLYNIFSFLKSLFVYFQ